MDDFLRADQDILEYYRDKLSQWVDEQRLMLQQSAALDAEFLRAQASVSDTCLGWVSADLDAQRTARCEVQRASVETAAAQERGFREELRALGEARAAGATREVAEAEASLRSESATWERREWERLDCAMQAVMLRHSEERSDASGPGGAGEPWERCLDAEWGGWAGSQRGYVDRLHADIDAEFGGAWQELEARLGDLTPEAMLSQPGAQWLAETAEAEATRLEAIELEVSGSYRSEIDDALELCEQSYRDYELELQRILFDTLKADVENAAQMRQYKLALCRWRLDYQRTFHERSNLLMEGRGSQSLPQALGLAAGDPQRRQRQQLAHLRGLVRDLWSQSQPPVTDIMRFLGSVAKAAAQAGRAAPVLELYEEELRQYGAVPLLAHAAQPDVLECWFQGLREPDPAPQSSTSMGLFR